MNEANCRKIIDFYRGINKTWDKKPVMTLAVDGINALVMGMLYMAAKDGEDWMAYGAFFLLGLAVLSILFSVGYLISWFFKKTKVMFSLFLCLSFISVCLMFLYGAFCSFLDGYRWTGALVLVIIFLAAFLLWNVWMIRCIWKDIRDGCYSGNGKAVPPRIDNMIICIALFPLAPALGSFFFRRRSYDTLGREIGGIYVVYIAILFNMLLSKFIIKSILYTILCVSRKA